MINFMEMRWHHRGGGGGGGGGGGIEEWKEMGYRVCSENLLHYIKCKPFSTILV